MQKLGITKEGNTKLNKIITEKLERFGLMDYELFKKRRRATEDSRFEDRVVECIIDFLQQRILPNLKGYQQCSEVRAILREKIYNKTTNLKT
jgi:hypothetical protein